MDATQIATIGAAIAPHAGAIKSAVDTAGDVVKEILKPAVKIFADLCGPPAAQLGLMGADTIAIWRAQNIAAIADMAKPFVTVSEGQVQLKAPPRLLHDIIESGSWCDDPQLQSMWAGLLGSSLTATGKDATTLIFADTLKRLTPIEAKMIDYACRESRKQLSSTGEGMAEWFYVETPKFFHVSGVSNLSEAGYLLGHLASLGLLRSENDPTFTYISEINAKGIATKTDARINLTPSRLALEFYIRCNGSRASATEFFKIVPER